MNQIEYDLPNLDIGMQLSRDLRRSSLGLDGSETERHRTRRSLMSLHLLERELGEEGVEVGRWLFSRSRGSRLVIADIFDGLPIASSSMADEYAVEYINEHIIIFRYIYEYIMYGNPEVERAYTQEEFDMSNARWREYENVILEGILSNNKNIKRRGVIKTSI